MREDVLFTHYSHTSQGQALGFVDRHGKGQTDGQLDPLQTEGAHTVYLQDHFGLWSLTGALPCAGSLIHQKGDINSALTGDGEGSMYEPPMLLLIGLETLPSLEVRTLSI
jgi:hypothetical protein